MKTKRITAFLLVTLTMLLFIPRYGAAALEEPEIEKNSAVILYHNESGTMIYDQNKDTRIAAGPAVRLTAALVFDEYYKERTGKTVTVNKKVTGLALSTLNPRLKTGEKVSVYDLLCAMLIANSNDAVYALAFDMFEGEEDPPARLMEAMQNRANALGMSRTHYADLVGKDVEHVEEGSYTCAEDLLKLALEVQRSTLLVEICQKASHSIPDTNLTTGREKMASRNDMISTLRRKDYKYAPVTGLAADNGPVYGYDVIATAAFGSKHFTCIVMGCKSRPFGAFVDAKTLLEWGNANFSYKKVLDETRILGEIKVTLSGSSDYISVVPGESVSAYLPNDLEPEKEISVKPVITLPEQSAPVYEGLIVGKAVVSYNGRELARVNLVTNGSLSQSNNQYYVALIKNFLQSRQFLYICIIAAALFVIYVLISARVRYLRQRRPAALTFDEEEGRTPLLLAPEQDVRGKSGDAVDGAEGPDRTQELPASAGKDPAPEKAEKKNAPEKTKRASFFGALFRRRAQEKKKGGQEGTDAAAKERKQAAGEKRATSGASGAVKNEKTVSGAVKNEKTDPDGARDGNAAGAGTERSAKTDFGAKDGETAKAGKERAGQEKKNGANGPGAVSAGANAGAGAQARADRAANDRKRSVDGDAAVQAAPDGGNDEGKAGDAGEKAEEGVQGAFFPEDNRDDLLVFGEIGADAGQTDAKPSAPRDDYVPEGWGMHIRHD